MHISVFTYNEEDRIAVIGSQVTFDLVSCASANHNSIARKFP